MLLSFEMASNPKKKKIQCITAISISTADGKSIKCGSKVLKGKRNEFETLLKKVRETCAKSDIEVTNFKLFWVKSDEAQILINSQEKLQGKQYVLTVFGKGWQVVCLFRDV